MNKLLFICLLTVFSGSFIHLQAGEVDSLITGAQQDLQNAQSKLEQIKQQVASMQQTVAQQQSQPVIPAAVLPGPSTSAGTPTETPAPSIDVSQPSGTQFSSVEQGTIPY